MSYQFGYKVTPEATEIRLNGDSGPLPTDIWAIEAPATLLPGVDLTQRLVAAGGAIAVEDAVYVEHRAISGLSAAEAKSLGLPALADAIIQLETTGVITRPDFRIKLQWRRRTGQPVMSAARTGAWLRVGEGWYRVPDVLFEIASQVDHINSLTDDESSERLRSIASLREVLPSAISSALAETTGLIGQIDIAVADAFSLDLVESACDAKLEPILHRAGGNADELLLTAGEQESFGRDQFNKFATARPVYSLGKGKYVVLSPILRKALSEVRRVQSASLATKRALLASPRAFLREALGSETDDTVIESVFRETSRYAERVIGLGLWQPRVLPWIKLATTNWFGPESNTASGQSAGTESLGLIIGDRTVPLTEKEAEDLCTRIENAIGSQQSAVMLEVDGQPVSVPASYQTLSALERLRTARLSTGETTDVPLGDKKPDKTSLEREVLVIKPNEEEVELEARVGGRATPPLGVPASLATPPKQHQLDGLSWLQKAWRAGNPGVLLADDMGLGKTLQGLAFLAWLREGMASGVIAQAPILIVAPTGLLENWRAEHDRHLSRPGLGHCVQAYGRELASIRFTSGDGKPSLHISAVQAADWVLTTYETLRDYDRDFGQVRFCCLLLDEAQKIKTPGVRVTDAAKAMNAEFRVALTGTPVENRLADLWCITDAVHPACLGDLRRFSASYEKNPDVQRLTLLKSSLDVWHGGRPPLMLRRLKEDKLPDLPKPIERLCETVMQGFQLEQYQAAIVNARRLKKPGAVLEALQKIRAISLHPERPFTSDQEFIDSSARLATTFKALDTIAARKERVLIFLDDLELQAKLTGVIQRRYNLSVPPMIINGQVDGKARQARVDKFQMGPEEFGVMILSPRAGGVGLTLTRANHVIHLSRWWNPAVEDQCNGRVLRIGQTLDVEVHIPIAVLPDGRASFDQNLHALLERKRRLMRDALLPPSATDADRNELFQATVSQI
jgi:hypothetical protein